ncbi:uncharacterized protein LOC129716080 [Leucoraja erinacea]|uniref:uncharacterized protein LOC129716080 n=1 Tax=Leucoraja erinaceus TaxID=7782 RepID=UPI002453FBE4|nr:uncharacterized protein LOC129716080 [Leucoraja erinacea]
MRVFVALICVATTAGLIGFGWKWTKTEYGRNKRGKRGERENSNLFIQAHNELFGKGQVVCYPQMTSVTSLFTPSPAWGRTERLVKCQEKKTVPVKPVSINYDRLLAPPANCLPLPKNNNHSYDICYNGSRTASRAPARPCNFTTNNDNRQYENCFSNQGHGCIVINVKNNLTCALQGPVHGSTCNLTYNGVQCQVSKDCIPVNAGFQLLCGWANGTHLTVGSHHLPIPSYSNGISEAWRDWSGGGEVINTRRGCNGSLYTEEGYYFFFNGKGTNVLKPPFPKNVAVGALVPTTVPCPEQWTKPMARVRRRTVSAEFCAQWRNPGVRGATHGHAIGWGLLSMLTMGGVGGGEAAKNRNYLVCGLTILGNATTGALEAVKTQMAEMRMFSLQNRYALDYLLAREGGTCTVIKGKCMMGVQDRTSNITQHQKEITTFLDGINENQGWGNWGLGGVYNWIISIAIYAAIVVTCLFVGIAIVKCIIARLMVALSGLGTTPEEAKSSVRMMILQREQERLLPFPNDSENDEVSEEGELGDKGQTVQEALARELEGYEIRRMGLLNGL